VTATVETALSRFGGKVTKSSVHLLTTSAELFDTFGSVEE
jgi:hypothetical protein